MARRPKPFGVGPVRVRAINGPRDNQWYWRAEIHENGASRSVWSGWATRTDAAKQVAGIVAEVDFDPVGSIGDLETVFDLLDVWLGSVDARQDIAKSTQILYRRRSRQIARVLGSVLLERIRLSDLEGYRNRRLRERAASGTVAGELRILKIAWRWGSQTGICPARDLPSPPLKVSPVRNRYTPTQTEAAMVLQQLEGWERSAFLVLATTGCRIGEIASLRWDQIDLDRREITVTGKRKTRTIPVRDETVDALVAMDRTGAFVFPVAKTTLIQGLQRRLPMSCSAAGVPRFTPHGLRRMVQNTLAEAGVDIADYAAILGHSPQVALLHYRQVRPNSLRSAIAVAGLKLPTDTSQGTINLESHRTRKG